MQQRLRARSRPPSGTRRPTGEPGPATREALQELPSARDPWVVLQTIPGVIVDRVNVGGSESGQRSNYMAKGASSDENTWTLDGVVITDMAPVLATCPVHPHNKGFRLRAVSLC